VNGARASEYASEFIMTLATEGEVPWGFYSRNEGSWGLDDASEKIQGDRTSVRFNDDTKEVEL
jgi:hypothetical protein